MSTQRLTLKATVRDQYSIALVPVKLSPGQVLVYCIPLSNLLFVLVPSVFATVPVRFRRRMKTSRTRGDGYCKGVLSAYPLLLLSRRGQGGRETRFRHAFMPHS